MTPEFETPEGGYFEHWMEALEELDGASALPELWAAGAPGTEHRQRADPDRVRRHLV